MPDDPVLYDYNGDPIQTGTDPSDTTSLGPDSRTPEFHRDRANYQSYPESLFSLEKSYVLPFAIAVAQFCEVDLLGERDYARVLKPIKQTHLHVVISLANVTLVDDQALWDAVLVYARDVPIVRIHVNANLKSQRAGVQSVTIWRNIIPGYVMIGEPVGGPTIERSVAYDIVGKYLNNEVFSYKSTRQQGEVG